jgi:putative transposase
MGDHWRRFCKANGLEPSMSRLGNCWNNAVAESCFSRLKKDSIHKSLGPVRADIFDYIEVFLTIEPGATTIQAMSARGLLTAPRCEVRICLLNWR